MAERAQRPFISPSGDGIWWLITKYDFNEEAGPIVREQWDFTDQIDEIISEALEVYNSPIARRN